MSTGSIVLQFIGLASLSFMFIIFVTKSLSNEKVDAHWAAISMGLVILMVVVTSFTGG